MSIPASSESSGTEPSSRLRNGGVDVSKVPTEADLWELDGVAVAGSNTETAPRPNVVERPVMQEIPKDLPEPAAAKLKLNVSALEWASLSVLLAVLLGLGGFLYARTIARIPNESDRKLVNHFPVIGQHVRAEATVSFWRMPGEPSSDGELQLGKRLVPVVEISTAAGTGTLRVAFRNGKGEVVGDVVTQPISPTGKTQIMGTSGFENAGMHAAYRAGREKPWTAEIQEALAGKTSKSSFQKLFTTEISTQIR